MGRFPTSVEQICHRLRPNQRMDDTCYMCHKPASTREHAPPLCFFPEAKDLEPPQDLRKHLITVPSCPDHNLSASKDDEYALVLVR